MPVRGNLLFCPDCGLQQSQINLTNCENCGHDLGPPNVNLVSTEDELQALQKRYEDAKTHAVNNGTEPALDRFENFFNANVQAIINLPLEILEAWVKTKAYKSYHRAVEVGLRSIANPFNDRKRTAIDSMLYGTHGRDINFAALTLNNEGIQSYGVCRIILNEDSIRFRASLLEENPYNFVAHHNINFETLNIPLGYRSTWEGKLKLAVAKLYNRLTLRNTEKDFTEMVLLSTGDKNTDEFIEVHIFKELSNLVIRNVFVPVPKNVADEVSVRIIEEKCPGKVTRV